ncbi:hypothetical protein FH608_018020 [Nonomuraea phyllanthi]|uniref:Uncharacterized protein n=1 Tax=Nonomuraea phyllanthi TaxID=2219224 RepID=A0A5C4WIJ6_9ACTN|nr:hypothetical protein [Nonomuraea phyllanthi]KAB8194079.1 hypothetical protein FH608_018020 [Nonomuraea phyllanthi]
MPADVNNRTVLRRAAAFAAAGSMALYLLVKIVWVVLEVRDGTTGWVMLNLVTVVMALTGIALGLALGQRWGLRLPGRLVLAAAWLGSGFLVSLLPYMLLSTLLQPGQGADDAARPAWEGVFITIGFAGMAVGLVVALPLYLAERWPRAFAGRVDPRDAGPGRGWLLVPAAALAVLWSFWAAGGTAGLDLAGAAGWDTNARLLAGNNALCAALACWSGWVLSRGSGRRVPLWLPVSAGFVASGSLFAWGAWKLAWLVLPGVYRPYEYRAVALAEHGLAVVAGVAILLAVLRHYRRTLARHGYP